VLDRTGKIVHIERVNKLTVEKRKQVVAALVEGNSMRAISRMADVSRNTINKLLIDLGNACSAYQDKVFRNLNCRRVQCDEIWSFVGCKQKNSTPETRAKNGWGDVWTWVALDAETKLVPCWYVGSRDGAAAYHFINDLKARLSNRIQLTTDGHKAYVEAVEGAFGAEIDYAQLQKIYGSDGGPKSNAEIRYSPAQCMGAKKAIISGTPDYRHVSTSFTERQNLTMRMSMRRFTRLTNAFSNKVENHEHSVAVHYMYYNFGRIHMSLRVTPAMEAGVADHVWTLEEIIALID
jgi:IS1 family transposase